MKIMDDEAATGRKTEYQSDIMIVLFGDGDYYVSEKLHDREPYFKLLSERAHTSPHFHTYEEALAAATSLREKILDGNPDCRIIELDIKDYPKNAKKAEEIFYDENGEVLFGINSKGKKVFFFRAGEERYALIDKRLYLKRIEEKIEEYADDGGCSFDRMGRERAYRAAYDCNLPYLHYEIYKTKEFLKSFEWDRELFSCDIAFYKAYAEALEDSIEIQKQCVLTPRPWTVHLLNLTDREIKVDVSGYKSDIGTLDIVTHSSAEDFSVWQTPDEIFLVFSKKKGAGEEELARQLGLDDGRLYLINRPLTASVKTTEGKAAVIDKVIRSKLFEAGSGAFAYKIPEKYVALPGACTADAAEDEPSGDEENFPGEERGEEE